MKATFTESVTEGLNINHRKEDKFTDEWTAVSFRQDGSAETPVTIRIYKTESRAYACLWSWGKSPDNCQISKSGSGYAGGYGYHKASAAACSAIHAAGYHLTEDINGRGDTAIHEAVMAIADAITPGAVIYINHAHA